MSESGRLSFELRITCFRHKSREMFQEVGYAAALAPILQFAYLLNPHIHICYTLLHIHNAHRYDSDCLSGILCDELCGHLDGGTSTNVRLTDFKLKRWQGSEVCFRFSSGAAALASVGPLNK